MTFLALAKSSSRYSDDPMPQDFPGTKNTNIKDVEKQKPLLEPIDINFTELGRSNIQNMILKLRFALHEGVTKKFVNECEVKKIMDAINIYNGTCN